jgi:hypothetical protein
MSSSRKSLLEDEIGLLVRHFGLRRVRAAIGKFSNQDDEEAGALPHRSAPATPKRTHPTIAYALELIRRGEPAKYRLLNEFLIRLKARQVLPESEDIRYFAQSLGLKGIHGKSRKDMIPTLIRFLLDRDPDRLRADIQRADSISQEERQRGFSVLADKLLGGR